ncbi:MAG: hypothetical protein PHO95_04010 [Bacteroidales bacterium]|nr:hypothetical protein [Bacteroidales bacterium]
MKNRIVLLIVVSVALLASCTNIREKTEAMEVFNINTEVAESAIKRILEENSVTDTIALYAGVNQVAQQWKMKNGTADEFVEFCSSNYASTPELRRELFNKLSVAFETIWGGYNKMHVELKKPMHLDGDPLTQADYIFGAYDPSSHLSEDLYNNKIAFMTILNFPFYTLKEKEERGDSWSRLEWAYARLGDIFTPDPPAKVKQMVADAEATAEGYIADYNIMMGHLLAEDGRKLFPEEMVLLSHWNLRDEIKSNYANVPNNLEKQRMILKVMLHIVEQTIPKNVINNSSYDWKPYSNTIIVDGKESETTPEGARRYEVLLNQFRAQQEVDKYSFAYPDAISRAFDGAMQIRVEDIEQMFTEYVSSPKVAKVAEMISKRLGRELEPFDIWYDGFKSRSSISEEALSAKTKSLYPDAQAFDKAIPMMLRRFGFPAEKAEELGGAIVVEAARGSGHAWGASSREDMARLRTRLSKGGMDYKGFNIAVHELGHNVEQTISLRDVDYYLLNGVPNTAFTEANAFVFQKRDLQLLGYSNSDPEQAKMTELDIFWGSYEIMGVALVDINVWRWMYANPDADANMLKEAVINIAKDIWNKYYKPVLGGEDLPLLAIYSHMINTPLYLANYPLGHIIEYQLEKFYQGKDWAKEVMRIYSIGSVAPQKWMMEAVGEKISTRPMLED